MEEIPGLFPKIGLFSRLPEAIAGQLLVRKLGLFGRVSKAARKLAFQYASHPSVHLGADASRADVERATRDLIPELVDAVSLVGHGRRGKTLEVLLAQMVTPPPWWARHLVSLDLQGSLFCQGTNAALVVGVLECSPGLRSLNLSNCSVDERALATICSALMPLTSMCALHLSHNVWKADVPEFGDLIATSRLTTLDVSINDFSLASRNRLGATLDAARTVRDLDVCYWRLSALDAANWATVLRNLPLESLQMKCFTADAWHLKQVVRRLPHTLRVLDLGNIKGRASNIAKGLQKLLPSLRLERLDVSGNPLGLEGIGRLAAGLRRTDSSRFQSLDVELCSSGFRGLNLLIDVVRHFSALRELNLGDNKSRPGGAHLPSTWATYRLPTTLEKLELANMDLGGETLMSVLRHAPRPRMRVLDLGGMTLESGGIALLEAYLRLTPTLCWLSLADCRLSYIQLGQIMPALCVHGSLQSLVLRTCKIDDDGGKTIVDNLAGMTRLELLDLSDNPLGVRMIEYLREHLAKLPSGLKFYLAENAFSPGEFQQLAGLRGTLTISHAIAPRYQPGR